MNNDKSKVTAYVLWLLVGAVGGHRFYLGRIKTGIALAALLVSTIAASVAGSVYMMQAIENGEQIVDLALEVNPFTILTYSAAVLMVIWIVWYALDLIFIHFMMKKDRANSPVMSQTQTKEVFE